MVAITRSAALRTRVGIGLWLGYRVLRLEAALVLEQPLEARAQVREALARVP